MTAIRAPRKIVVDFLLDWLVAHGCRRDDILALPTLSRLPPADGPISLSIRDYLSFFNEAAQMYGDEYLGLHIGRDTDTQDFGYAGNLLHYCSTVRDSWQALERYLCTIHPQMVLHLEEEEINSRLDYEVLSFSNEYSRHDVDTTLAAVVRFFRTYAGEHWHPDSVHFKHDPPSNASEYTRFFDAELYFNQPSTALVFASEVLDITVSNTNPELLRVMREHAESMLANANTRDNLVTKVRYLIASTLGTEQCSSSAAASTVFMSQRSFNRELKRFGTSFRDLKLDVIEEIAKRSLAETAASVSEIALNLGYSETTAFDRVFKKQAGVTPSAYRKMIDRGVGDSPSPPF